MPEAQRYVVVSSTDLEDKDIKGGPYKWDGQTAWQPPVEGTLLLESDAFTQGYSYPANLAEGEPKKRTSAPGDQE